MGKGGPGRQYQGGVIRAIFCEPPAPDEGNQISSNLLRCMCRLLALSVISLLRSDSVAFGCEADMRTVDRSSQSDVNDPERTHGSRRDTAGSQPLTPASCRQSS